jgi:uncharacterized protein (DUF488 family)
MTGSPNELASANPFFTVGHSTRSVCDLAALLREAGADFVVDVRTVPRSRTNPQFNRDTLSDSLAEYQIGYAHLAELGGLRGKQHSGGSSPNTFWQNASFRNYADYALTAPFQQGLDRLLEMGGERRCAVMCAEAVWWRCHRRIIADYLILRGARVIHILDPAHMVEASLTPSAHRSNGGLIYRAHEEA